MAFTPVLRLCLTLEVMLCRKIFKTSITRGTCTSQLKKKNTENSIFTVYSQGAGAGIGVPFNVQHVAHIGVDNVEALLLAAKEDPKLLPSFLLPEGIAEEKEDSKWMADKSDTKIGELM